MVDLASFSFHTTRFPRNPNCVACSDMAGLSFDLLRAIQVGESETCSTALLEECNRISCLDFAKVKLDESDLLVDVRRDRKSVV